MCINNKCVTNYKCLGSFFAFFAKIWPKNMHRSSKSRFFFVFFFVWPFLPGELRWPWFVLYGHKTQEMILTNVNGTIHADSLVLCAFNSEIVLADVKKPEKSNILTLAWSVTSLVTSRPNFTTCLKSSRTRIEWRLDFGNRSSSLGVHRGGAETPPPPQQNVWLARAQRSAG